MLRQQLTQKQKLKISQQNILLFRLLELNTQQFEDKIKEELEENPALELQDNYFEKSYEDDSPSESIELDEIDFEKDIDYNEDNYNENSTYEEYYESKYKDSNEEYYPDDDKRDNIIPVLDNNSLISNLLSQYKYLESNPRKLEIGEYIIGNIDSDGYLRRTSEQLVDELSFRQNLYSTETEIEEIIVQIQNLDPPGIAARSIEECLINQLKARKDSEEKNLAIHILSNYFDSFARKQITWLSSKLKVTKDKIQKVYELILSLNPKPIVESLDQSTTYHIVPDFLIYNENGKLKIELHSKNLPTLEINQEFLDLLKQVKSIRNNLKNNESVKYLKEKVDNALMFITTIKQRQETMILIIQGVAEYQKNFFLTGNEEKIKPMTLKDISDNTGYDISTISRVCNSKYIQTEYGVYSLKYFFSEGIENYEGEEISSRSIKSSIKELVASEDASNPYTDEQLVEKLKEKGYKIARRTISKYRDQLEIPPRHLRRIS